MNIDNILFPQHDTSGSLIVDGSYSLPVVVTDRYNFNEQDAATLSTMKAHAPATRLRAGDLTRLIVVPSTMHTRFGNAGMKIPRVWKIRHVISRWSWEIYRMYKNGEMIYGIDHAANMLDIEGVAPELYASTLVYAHGYPHGMYPNTASWFQPYMLKKLVIREDNEIWPSILNEADTTFTGYDRGGHLNIDLAPDLYSLGKNVKRPFGHEEVATHTAAGLGLEELMMVPMAPMARRRKLRNEEAADDYSSSPSPSPPTTQANVTSSTKTANAKIIVSPWAI